MKLLVRFALLLFLLCGISPLVYAAGYEDYDIARIELKGNINTDSSLIRAQLSSRVGSRFSYRLVSRDVKDLYSQGYFSNIQVDVTVTLGSIILTYIFEEYDKVEEIIIKGNSELSTGDIREVMTLQKDTVYSAVWLQRDIEAIQEAYRKKGFRNAGITSTTRTDAETHRVYIGLDIKEGSKIVVEKISIIGARQLDAGSVKRAIDDTHESGLFRSGVFDEKNFEKDKARIVEYYHTRGFIKMSITRADVRIAPVKPGSAQQGIFLDIYVDEGKRYKMGEYFFEGNYIFTSAEILRKFFRLKSGAFFDAGQNEKDQMTLWQAYSERGYIRTEITPIRQIDEQTQVVNLTFKIRESEIAHVRNIRIKGNTRTLDYVVKREMRIKEGEVFNSSAIRRSQERLFNLRYFKDVNIDVEPVREHEGLMDLIFSVKEDRTGLFTLGAGYGTATGFSFFAQISENNLLGRGLTASGRGELGQKRQSIMLGIDTPYTFLYDPTSLGFSVSYSDTRIENINTNYMDTALSVPMRGDDKEYHFSRKAFEIQLRAGRSLSEWWRGYASYTFAWVNSYGANFVPKSETDAATLSASAQEYIRRLRDALARGYSTKSSARIGLLYDTRDYIGGPSRGIYASQFLTYTGGILGGASQLILSESNFSFFIPLFWNLVFAVDTKMEAIFDQLDGRSNIYPGDELQFDGMTELRGWRDYYYAGRGKISSMTELRIPIDKRMFWGVVFYDMGKLWEDYDKISLSFKEYKHSVGLGLRLQLTVLPIRFYLARKFEYDEFGKVNWIGGTKFFKGWETVFSVAGIF
ncbi:MAG: outer membrane protein assembly factor BamA [Spirochaetota bacterium]|jgi:outer membrane protein insertion porin family|nr:outer membrane protein assembly factor BamA [Spirochaetota bacterium]